MNEKKKKKQTIYPPDGCEAIILFCNNLIGADAGVLLEWSITLVPIFMPEKNKEIYIKINRNIYNTKNII